MGKRAEQAIPETMLEAVRQFADPKVAHDFFVQMRFPNGVACPRLGCGSAAVTYLPKYMRWYCRDCKRQFSAKVGTIFEDSPIGLDKWLPAIWLLASNRNGISSCELSRALHVTQKTAWFMLHRIRLAMQNDSFVRFMGPVEADETYVGGRHELEKDHHGRARRIGVGPNAGKTTVMGIVERHGGRVRAFVLPPTPIRDTLATYLRPTCEPGSTVYTDSHPAYTSLKRDYTHYVINHAREYVRGHVHTNSIESFWSLFKRTVRGTYIAPRPWHLQRYVEEQVFRFNERHENDGARFVTAVKSVDGKRLTYKALTLKV